MTTDKEKQEGSGELGEAEAQATTPPPEVQAPPANGLLVRITSTTGAGEDQVIVQHGIGSAMIELIGAGLLLTIRGVQTGEWSLLVNTRMADGRILHAFFGQQAQQTPEPESEKKG